MVQLTSVMVFIHHSRPFMFAEFQAGPRDELFSANDKHVMVIIIS